MNYLSSIELHTINFSKRYKAIIFKLIVYMALDIDLFLFFYYDGKIEQVFWICIACIYNITLYYFYYYLYDIDQLLYRI